MSRPRLTAVTLRTQMRTEMLEEPFWVDLNAVTQEIVLDAIVAAFEPTLREYNEIFDRIETLERRGEAMLEKVRSLTTSSSCATQAGERA